MTLDSELVCPECRRFWHGPPGRLPYPATGERCVDPKHASTPSPAVQPLIDPRLQEAYELGCARDPYVRGRKEAFVWKKGESHRSVMGLAYASEKKVSLATGRRWLNAEKVDDGPDNGDVEGIAVRHTQHTHGLLAVGPGEKHNPLPHVLVTGDLDQLVIRGWLYMHEIKRDEWWQAHWPHPAWGAPQHALRHLSTIPPLGGGFV